MANPHLNDPSDARRYALNPWNEDIKTIFTSYPHCPLGILASCDFQGARDQKACTLYNADKIDAVEALKRLGLQANENGQRFEAVETTCAQFRQLP